MSTPSQIRCLGCHTECSYEDRYCQTCGSLLPRSCDRCGHVNRADAAFCGRCGVALGAETDLPRSQVSKLVEGLRYGHDGERKLVSVLFADIANSSAYIRDMDPEDSVRAMERPLEIMIAAVRRYEGTLAHVQGDGIMAIFGAPQGHEDDAVRACLAGLEIQRAMDALGAEGLKIRVGISSGTVVIRSLANDLWAEYDASGPVVNLANRMQHMAEPGTVCCSGSTYALAKDFIEMCPLGPTDVRGFGSPVLCFQPLRPLLAATRWQVRASLGLSAFVGRDAEYELCMRALHQATTERGQCLIVTGEAGIGKSRLVHEIIRSAAGHHIPVHETSALPHGSKIAFMPISRLLRGWFDVQDRDTPEEVRNKLTRSLQETLPDGSAIQPALESLLDLPVTNAAWSTPDDRSDRRQQVIAAIETFIHVQAARSPAVIVFEDVHWNDSDTNEVLERLVASLSATRILLIATCRPEADMRWASLADCIHIDLRPFDRDLTTKFLRRALGEGDAHRRLTGLLANRTQGIPLYLEEALRTLLESGALVGDLGDLHLVREVEVLEIPDTLKAVIAARIDRLAPELKRIVQTASVVGSVIPFVLLRALTGLADGALRQHLEDLKSASILYESRLVPDLELTFMHVLIHDVAYESLLIQRRRALHARVVEAIEHHHAGRLTEHAEELAHHAMLGDLPAKAATCLVQVGERAMDRCAYAAAIDAFETALGYLERAPVDRSAIELGIDVRLRLRAAIGVTGDYARWLTFLDQAEGLAERLEDERRRAAISVSRTHVLNVVGNAKDAVQAGLKAAAITRPIKDQELIVTANYFLAQAYEFHGDYRRALSVLRSSLGAATGDQQHARMGTTGTTSVLYLSLLAYCCAFLGRFRRGALYSAEACRLALEIDRPFDIALAQFATGVLNIYRGNFQTAAVSLEQGFGACDKGGISILRPVIASRLGYVYAVLGGRNEHAIELAEGAVREAERMPHMLGWCLAYLSFVRLLTGEHVAAHGLAERARSLADHHGYRGMLVWALWVLGSANEEAGTADLDYLRGAIGLAESLGLASHAAMIRTDLGQRYQRRGLQHDARKELTAAVQCLRRLRGGYWLDRAVAVLSELTDQSAGENAGPVQPGFERTV